MKKGYRFKGDYPCPYCSHVSPSPQGKSGHIWYAHREVWDRWRNESISEGVEPAEYNIPVSPAEPTPTPSVAELRLKNLENQILEAEAKGRRLRKELGDTTQKRYPDISEESGLGSFDPNLKARLQSKVFDNPPPEPKDPWYSHLLSPEGLPLIISALKGVLGLPPSGVQQGQGDGILSMITTLQALGIDVKGLVARLMSPGVVSDGSIKIGGIVIPAGVPLTEGVFEKLLDVQSKNEMADTLKSTMGQVAELIKQSGSGGGISRQRGEGVTRRQMIECPQCGVATLVPTDLPAGEEFPCSNPDCEGRFVCEADEPESKPIIQKTKVRKEPDMPTALQCECGQLVAIPEGTPIGTWLPCPVCGKETPVMSDKIPVMPAKPKEEEE